MTITRDKMHRCARLAGEVERYHTWPTIRRQSVAEHTWQVMRVWLALFGPAPQGVWEYVHWHDAGELVTGDSPFPSKSQLTEGTRNELRASEILATKNMGGSWGEVDEEDRTRAKICDLLEMYEFAIHEMTMGNRFAEPVRDDIRASVLSLAKTTGWTEQDKIVGYMDKIERMWS